MNKLLQQIHSFILRSFKLHQIPPGYHELKSENNIIYLRSTDIRYSYPNIVDKNKFKEELENEIIGYIQIVVLDQLTLGFQITQWYPWLLDQDNLISGDVNKADLKYQLNVHNLIKVDDPQYIFDSLCCQNNDYYNELYLKNWSGGYDFSDYSNDEIIKVLLNLNVIITYDNLLGLIKTKRERLVLKVLDRIELNDVNKNYELLSSSLYSSDLIKILIVKFKQFKDWGILTVAIRSNYSNEILNSLLGIATVDTFVLREAIEYNCNYMIEYIIKNKRILITEEILLFCRELKKDKIYSRLCDVKL